MIEAAEAAQIAEFVRTLPEGALKQSHAAFAYCSLAVTGTLRDHATVDTCRRRLQATTPWWENAARS